MTRSVPTTGSNSTSSSSGSTPRATATSEFSETSFQKHAIKTSFDPVDADRDLKDRQVTFLTRPREKESKEVEKPEFPCKKSLNEHKFFKLSGTAPIRYAITGPLTALEYLGWAGKWLGKNSWADKPTEAKKPNWHTDIKVLKPIVSTVNSVARKAIYVKQNLEMPAPIYNQMPFRARDFVETTKEEDEGFHERLDKALDHYLTEYNKDKKHEYEKIDKKDVVGKYIHHFPKKDGTLNYKRQFSFRIVYRKKDKKNNYILDKNNNYTYDLKYLFIGKINEDVDYDHPILEALGVFKNFQYLSDESGSNDTLRKTYQTGVEYLKTKNISHETEKDKKTVSPDKLICSYHAALNLFKDKKEKFDMTKDAMDRKAMDLKAKVNLGGGEQDVHEVLIKSDLINKAKFAVERTYTLQADPTKGLAEEELKKTANIALPVLALGDKENNIQQMFNKHLENSDKLPTDFKDKNENVRSIEKEEITYLKKPPYLLLGIERYKRENPTAETTKITTKITDVDSVTIAKKHIKNATKDTKYSLKGFIFHKGATPNSGHYITYTQNPDGKWVIFDNIKTDTNGNFVDYGRVIDANDTDFDDRKKAAYVYLYEEEETSQ